MFAPGEAFKGFAVVSFKDVATPRQGTVFGVSSGLFNPGLAFGVGGTYTSKKFRGSGLRH